MLAKGPVWGQNVHEVDTARRTNKARACSMSVCCERGAQTKVDEEYFSESCRGCAVTVKVPANLKIFPKTTQIVKKLPN